MCLILSIQALIYPRGKNRISPYAIALCIGLWLFIIIDIIFTEVFI